MTSRAGSRQSSRAGSSASIHKTNGEPWGVKAIGCGVYHSAALTNYGHLYTWGGGERGQLGQEASDQTKQQRQALDKWTPQRVLVKERVMSLAVGYEHTLAATFSGRLWAWGRGDEGQLGTSRLKNEFQPCLVVGFTNQSRVKAVSAGEQHSAAIVEPQGSVGSKNPSRWLYTWGSCESGKLGLGDDVSSGQKASAHRVPSKWNQDGQVGEPVMVCCGENHTGVLVAAKVDEFDSGATPGDVWIFGGGWFGRLGLGKTDNEYTPQLVTDQGLPNMTDLSCGAFHTCAVSEGDEELWAWGRDKLVCEPKHILRPKKFTHIEGAVKIVKVICGTQHTLVMSRTSAGDGHDLWVWGDNSSSQLAQGENASDNIFIPVQVRSLPGQAKLVATAASHSMALLANDELYAWGNQSSGRLGLEQKQKAKLVRNPAKVNAGWASIETMCELTQDSRNPEAVEDGIGEETTLPPIRDLEEDSLDISNDGREKSAHLARMLSCIKGGQKLENFATVQEVLRSEQEEAKIDALKRKEDQVELELRRCLALILDLPQKESHLRMIESCFIQSLGSNLKFFRGVETPEATVNEHIQPKLRYYEELLWVLQQQPTYLAVLSICLEGNRSAEKHFYSAVSHLYNDLSISRTHHLFVAALKLMASKEIEAAKDAETVFTENVSRLVHCFTHFAQKRAMLRHAASRNRGDPDSPRSLRQQPSINTQTIIDANGEKLIVCDLSVVDRDGHTACLLNAKDVLTALLLALQKLKDRIYLNRAEFEQAREGTGEDSTSEYMQSLDRFKDFMLHFRVIIMQFALDPPVRMIFSHVLEEVRNRQFAPAKVVGAAGEVANCLPLLQLYVRGILVPLLLHADKMSEKILDKEVMAQVTEENWHNLGKVREFCELLAKDVSSQGKKEKFVEAIAVGIRADILKYLLEQANFYDNTDTEILIDMYTSHFDREPQTVLMPTSTLMYLSNMLLEYMQRLRLKEDDPVERLTKEIGPWDEKLIHQIHENEEHLHNFTMNTRFLFEEKAFTICSQSLCPMPPRLCAKSDTSDRVLMRYGDQNKHKDRHFELMQILTEIDRLKPTIVKMSDLKEELEAQQSAYKANKASRNFDMAKKLLAGINAINALQSMEANEANLFAFIATSVLERDLHRAYLQDIERGIQSILEVQETHWKKLKRAEIDMAGALEASLSCKVPDRFIKAAQNMSVPTRLDLQRVNAKIKDLGEYKREKQPTFAFCPTATYSLDFLMKRNIVVSVEGVFQKLRQDKVQLIFSFMPDSTLEISCCVFHRKRKVQISRVFDSVLRHGSPHGGYIGRSNQNIVAVIKLSQQQLKELQRAQANTKLPEMGEPCFTFNSENLVNLVTAMST
eukprot:CAMPEP_0178384882 /NCGR_PEP_ID=MMETSP0689_2-20121128/7746_1 /TAXON_ID=160604 /ORGANISM="Amphidinium massartii, Strain CS-259" /LENGTH=1356 /DNA_ID=CAMNT_0020005147 /DNA_START=51 /DNA_END=4117 /DNA_ORIENTATION=+